MIKSFSTIKSTFKNRNFILSLSGIILGAAGGFMYYYFIGCRTGTCPITSSPWISMLWGASVGYLVFDMFRKKKDQSAAKNDVQP